MRGAGHPRRIPLAAEPPLRPRSAAQRACRRVAVCRGLRLLRAAHMHRRPVRDAARPGLHRRRPGPASAPTLGLDEPNLAPVPDLPRPVGHGWLPGIDPLRRLRPVGIVVERLPNTLLLGLTGLLAGAIAGLGAGYYAAAGRLHAACAESAVRSSTAFEAVPSFFLGVIFMAVVQHHLGGAADGVGRERREPRAAPGGGDRARARRPDRARLPRHAGRDVRRVRGRPRAVRRSPEGLSSTPGTSRSATWS